MVQELTKTNKRRYQHLRELYWSDPLYQALVDMSRNLAFENEVAAYWYGHADYVKLRKGTKFSDLYDSRELDFLKARGVY